MLDICVRLHYIPTIAIKRINGERTMDEIIYQCEATSSISNPKIAAQEFARSYWAEPRKIRWNNEAKTFQMVGGNRTYKVALAYRKEAFGAIPLFQISVANS
jgi:hypothetical protein